MGWGLGFWPVRRRVRRRWGGSVGIWGYRKWVVVAGDGKKKGRENGDEVEGWILKTMVWCLIEPLFGFDFGILSLREIGGDYVEVIKSCNGLYMGAGGQKGYSY